VASYSDHTLKVWSLAKMACLATLHSFEEIVAMTTFIKEDELFILTGSESGIIHLY